MKKLVLPLIFSIVAALAWFSPTSASGQIHPLAFQTAYGSNYYRDYVGFRLQVTAPTSIAGDYANAVANDGSVSGSGWGAFLYTPIVDVPIYMASGAPGDDSFGCSSFTSSMAGKIAVLWRGPYGAACDFSTKAYNAQLAGAVAVVIINEYPFMGPGIMAAGTLAPSVTIPAFMIGNVDGVKISAQYHTLPPNTIKMSLTPWGKGFTNDLGFVPGGAAGWHCYAIPSNQLASSGGHIPYKGMNGAFIANYGSHNATNVKLKDTLRYTPTGGTSTVVYTDATPTLSTFTPFDSIYAMFAASEYSFAPTAPGTGRFDLKYTITSDSLDLSPSDNSLTYSFYTTDSVYSKGRYDFVHNEPVRSKYVSISGTYFYDWGPMYHVAHPNSAISSVQLSVYNSSGAPGVLTTGTSSINIYAFKWVDGSASQPLDGLVENAELSIVSQGVYSFLPTDTSGQVLKVRMGDPTTGLIGSTILLDSNSNYFIAAELPAGYLLGCDGDVSASLYPRVYGRYHTSSYTEYAGIQENTYIPSTPNIKIAPCPFPGTTNANAIDSFNFSDQKGYIPAIALIVNNSPIVGSSNVCLGSTTTLTDGVSGGTWSSSTPSVATIGSVTGIVSGIATGTTTITYTFATGIATKIVSVVTMPATAGTISGTTTSVCVGNTITLTDAVAGGTWSSSSTAIATIGSSTAIVTGVAGGTAHITYTVTNMCGSISATANVTVIAPPAISGPSSICVGASATLGDAATGGTWSSSSANASIGSSSGVLTGVSAGTTIVSYTIPSGCVTTTPVTINPNPVAILGSTPICAGASLTLTDATTGGTWSSSMLSIATIGSGSGIANGVAAGTAVISYILPTGCRNTTVLTVNPLPSAITGSTSTCMGTPATLSSTPTGGTWSATGSVATIGSSSGIVNGLSYGTMTVTYTISTGCSITTSIAIDSMPVVAAITGASAVCEGADITLSNTALGGSWSSTTTGVATVGSASGIVSGVAAGTTTISYSVTNGCGTVADSVVVTVNPLPDAGSITGSTSVCEGYIITLSDAVGGGTWSSSNANATVSATGAVTGVTAGTSTISYTTTNGCGNKSATIVITVTPASVCSDGVAITADSKLKIYPNPSTGSFVIDLPQTNGVVVITINDVLGKTIESKTVETGVSKLNIDLLNKPAGNYFITVLSGSNVLKAKLVLIP